MSAKMPLRAASSSTLTSYAVISPRTSTSTCWATSPARAVKIRPSFSTSGMPGRTSSAITPPWTLTASGTSSPARASRTERATATPAFSWASSVDAPRWGVATTFSSSKSGESVQGSCGEHVEARRRDLTGLERVVERLLVDDAAARRVDDDQVRPGAGELLGADQADRLRGLGQVHRQEVRLGHQLLETDHPHPHLGRAPGLDVRVVGDHVHAERGQPGGDEHADATEPDDADGLLEQLDAGVAAALPLPAGQRGVGGADVPRGREHQRDRELRRADDVGGRCVHDHHAVLRRGTYVDVVEPHAGARHHPEAPSGRQRLGVDVGGRADQDRVGLGDRGEQRGAIGAVAGADLEVGAEGVDRGGTELLGDEDDGPRARGGGHNDPDVGARTRSGPGMNLAGPARRCASAA